MRSDDFDPDDTARAIPEDVDRVRGLLGSRPVTSRAIVATLQIGKPRVLAALLELRAKRTPFGWTL